MAEIWQGEEAKIIIVSLVRSNENHSCGFLKTSNRINVLLRYIPWPLLIQSMMLTSSSRAQHGMYIIGDAETSQGIPMWSNVIGMLEAKDNIGPTLELQCPRHPNTPINVASPDDFSQLAPEGGCSERCDKRLNRCGHACILRCHSDALHALVRCEEECPRQFSHCQHVW